MDLSNSVRRRIRSGKSQKPPDKVATIARTELATQISPALSRDRMIHDRKMACASGVAIEER